MNFPGYKAFHAGGGSLAISDGEQRSRSSFLDFSDEGSLRDLNRYVGRLLARAREIVGDLEDNEIIAHEDRRTSARALTVYRLVHVECGGDQGFARCRNISDKGVKLDLAMPVSPGHSVKITFPPDLIVTGKVIWSDGTSCGLEFDETLDCSALLRRSAAEARSEGFRHPRLKAMLGAHVRADSHRIETVIHDISQRGMKLSHDGTFRPGLQVYVVLSPGREKRGVVRWSRDNLAGIMLEEPFSIDDLGSIQALGSARDDQ